jgi:hypothetical protein
MNIPDVHYCTPNQAIALVEDCMYTKLVPMLHGSPAIGKSSIIHQLADKLNLLVIDARMAGFDPTDLQGFPALDPAKGLATYMPMDTFPLVGQAIPTNPKTNLPYEGWVLFLDEFNSAPLAVQAAAYKLILDRMVGAHKLHDHCLVVCAGNLDDDGAITNPMSSAMVSRIVHIVVKPNLKEWMDWAVGAGISTKILSFLEFKAQMFYTFDSSEPAHIYASPRTWEFANRLFMRWGETVTLEKTPLLVGTISDGVTTEFRSYLAFYQHLPSMADIMASPQSTPVPNLPGVLYALDGSIADWLDAANIEKMLTYIDRMPEEHRVILFRMALRRNPKIRSNTHFLQWATANASYFIH